MTRNPVPKSTRPCEGSSWRPAWRTVGWYPSRPSSAEARWWLFKLDAGRHMRMGGRFPVSESFQRPTSSGRKFQSHRSALRAPQRLNAFGLSPVICQPTLFGVTAMTWAWCHHHIVHQKKSGGEICPATVIDRAQQNVVHCRTKRSFPPSTGCKVLSAVGFEPTPTEIE